MPHTKGYILGRLFAFLALHKGLDRPAEELYQLASTAPPQVLPKALATMIGAGKEELLFPLMKQLPLDAFDGPLNRREQGAFAMGYTHERAGYVVSLAEEGEDEEPGLTERYEFRLDPPLKEWLKMRGGGTFLRTILRNERARVAQEPTSSNDPTEGKGH
ncbi:MAG: hypothetical protein NVS2B12_32860 [Ktedonobacteraceae bacterium]